ncbi:MAG: hypothetical protein UZ15_CFX003001507 [Chloroflexi bacterium OLB15]|nr:MAG: hypothetical protein UZ15_CFX003001507 [Chloroflexi bacterium OLB15]
MGYGSRYARRGGGPPAWLIFLVAVALVFGAYYLIRGAQDFVATGGLGVDEATARAQIVASATANRVTRMATQQGGGIQLLPTGTPLPECIDFRVVVPNAVVRSGPSSAGAIVTGYPEGTVVCVISRAAPDSEWYLIDQNPRTRRIEEAFMHEEVIDAVNPTPTPSNTRTPMPSVTPAPTSENPSATPTPTPSNTLPPDFRPTIPGAPNLATITPEGTETISEANG